MKGTAGLLRLTWDEAWGIKERAVTRGLSRRTQEVIPHVGVDEKAIAKRHRYLTVVADLERHRVLYLAEDRKQESLDGFWATLTPAQREGIQAIAMDMWEPYIQSTQASLPTAETKIVFDKFHVAKHLHTAVDQVRQAEHRALKQDGDARLTSTKYLWLMRPKDMSPEQRATFRALQQHTDLKVAAGLGPQGALPPVLGLHLSGRRPEVLCPLVLARHAQPAAADGRGREAHPPPSAQRADLSAAWNHQCRPRGGQCDHPMGEENGTRLPQRRAF